MPNTTQTIYCLTFPGVQKTSPLPTGCYPSSGSLSAGGKRQGTSRSGAGSPTTPSQGPEGAGLQAAEGVGASHPLVLSPPFPPKASPLPKPSPLLSGLDPWQH